MKKIFFNLIIFSLVINFFVPVAFAQSTAEATLFLSPASREVDVDSTFTVGINVNSGGGDGINASEASIKFDPNFLVVTNVTKGDLFKLWTEEPAFSNTAGTITFGGGAPSAYRGNSGNIVNVTFSTKKAGETSVTFSSGVVLAMDGLGTNVLNGFGNATYTIKEKEVVEEPEPKEEPVKEVIKEEPKKEVVEEPKEDPASKGIAPPLPEIDSITHKDENLWYSNNVPEFSWKILPDLTGISYLITDSPDSDPGAKSDGVIEAMTFEEQKDGEWYFHLKYQNTTGWGQIAHKKFMIDVTPPEAYKISVDMDGDSTNPAPKLVFKTEDLTSGLDYFDIKIDLETIKVSPEQVSKGYYQLSVLSPGDHEIAITAYDKAGNAASSSAMFIIDPLKAPIISDVPSILNSKEELMIRGESFYKNVTLKIYVGEDDADPREFITKTDDNGDWSYVHKRGLSKGVYEVWAKVVDDRGAQSSNSSKHLLNVITPSIVDSHGSLIILLLLIIIIGLIIEIVYLNKKHIEEKKRIKRETEEVKRKLSKIFAALREEVDELIELADKKPGLSESERRVKEKLQESLDISEEFIHKEVEDVEKEIKLGKHDIKK